MYDLELAYMVVGHSQRDPGEYMIQLQQFGAVAEDKVRAAAIDRHLGRHLSALRHLVAAGHFDEALALAKEKVPLTHISCRTPYSPCSALSERKVQCVGCWGRA